MNGLVLYWQPREEPGSPLGRIQIEENKLLVKAEDPSLEQELKELLAWMERQQLCSRIVWADFDTFETVEVPAVCQPDDYDYAGRLQASLDGYLIRGKPIYAERF